MCVCKKERGGVASSSAKKCVSVCEGERMKEREKADVKVRLSRGDCAIATRELATIGLRLFKLVSLLGGVLTCLFDPQYVRQ